MSPKQMSLCDAFVYIPQHGPGTASLNVTVAASVVLHHFAVWAGFPERERRQHKFVVAERPERNTARGVSAGVGQVFLPRPGSADLVSGFSSIACKDCCAFSWKPGDDKLPVKMRDRTSGGPAQSRQPCHIAGDRLLLWVQALCL